MTLENSGFKLILPLDLPHSILTSSQIINSRAESRRSHLSTLQALQRSSKKSGQPKCNAEPNSVRSFFPTYQSECRLSFFPTWLGLSDLTGIVIAIVVPDKQ